MKALCAEADRLQQSHPINASQIQVKREELIANWEQIRTLAAERHARLNDSYRWVTAAGQCCFPPSSHWTESSWKEKKGVQFPKFWSDSVVFGAVLFTKFYFTITSCSERNISMFEKLLQLFVISLGMGQLWKQTQWCLRTFAIIWVETCILKCIIWLFSSFAEKKKLF